MNLMSETTATGATYDRIAADYAARWSSPAMLAEARARFAARVAPGGRVLDIGCGPGWDTARLRELGLRVCGVDYSRGMLAQARLRGGLPLARTDMRRLPVRAAAMDGLWVCASFLHIPRRDGPATLREFHATLRPGGVLYIGVKCGDGERWIGGESGQPRFFTFYREDQIDALLGAAGFTVCEGWIGDDALGREPWINRLALVAPA